MRGVHREVREERHVRVHGGAHEVLGAAHVHAGSVVAVAVAVELEPAVVVERVAVLAVRGAERRADERGPSRGPVRGRDPVRIAVEVLADERGAIAGSAEPRGDGVLLDPFPERPLEPAVAAAVGPHTGVVRVLPAQRRHARRAAQRVADEVVVEGRAVVADQLPGVRHEAQLRPVEVVGEHEQDVGSPPRRGRGRRRPTGRRSRRRRR